MKQQLIIKNEIAEITRLNQFIETTGEQLDLSPKLIMNLNLVLEEAVSNVILYAYPNPDEIRHPIIIDIEKKGNTLIVTITDRGEEFDPTQKGDVDISLSVEERSVGGLGIFLIKEIMNEVEYQRIDGNNVFTLKKVIR